MTILQAILLGLIQGATEFIPVSSSGHLTIIPWLVGWETPGLTFSVAVHFGTMLSVVTYFYRDWLKMLGGALRWLRTRDNDDPDFRMLKLLVIATIPVGIIGVLFYDFFETLFNSPLSAMIMLLVTAAILVIGERLGDDERLMENLRISDGLAIGIAQILALLPGVSRSGTTIAAGRIRGLRRDDAARFSFLLATPIIIGAALLQGLSLMKDGAGSIEFQIVVVGFLSASVSGYFVIRWLLAFLRTRSTMIFAVYCVLLSIVSLLVFVIRGA